MLPQRNSSCVPRDQNKGQNSSGPPHSLSADEKLLVMEALDHIYVTKQYQGMGCCAVCKKISLKNCSGCSTYYCSSECQTFDWPKHRVICTKRDSSSEGGSVASSRRMRCTSSIKSFNEETYMINNRGSPFVALANQLSRKSGNLMNGSKDVANFKIANKQYQNREPHLKGHNSGLNGGTKDNKKNNSNGGRKSFSPKKAGSHKRSPPDDRISGISSKRDNKSNSQYRAQNLLHTIENTQERSVVSSSEKAGANSLKMGQIEVVCIYRESASRYWVMLFDNLKKYEEIQEALNQGCKNYETALPEVGLVCGCTFAGDWFRGKILSVTPVPVVHFIDYGNVSNCDTKEFKKLPDYLQTLPGLVFQIEFEEGTPMQYKTEDLDSLKLTVEETSKTTDGISRVRIIEGQYGATEKPLQLAKPPEKKKSQPMINQKVRSVMDTISANSNGMLFFMPGEGRIRFASMVPDNNKEANDSINKVLNIDSSNSSPIQAQTGTYVLVTDGEGNEQRGKILVRLDSTYYVRLVDCGNVISTKDVYPLSEDLKELLELGVKVTVEEIISQEQMKGVEPCFFEIEGEAVSGKWPCTLIGPEQQIIARVLLEKPAEKPAWKPRFPYLKSGSTVEISCVSSPNSFYVRPVDVEAEKKFLDMNMEMMQFARKAKNLDFPPSPGDLCCAKFHEDGSFYRAIVNSLEGGKASVLFVDFGNEQLTDLKDIKPLPETLKNVAVFAIRVVLKNVSPKPWNNMIKDYIGKLSSENVELTLTFTDKFSDGVTLREKVSGAIVNEFMEKARDKSASSSISSQPLSKRGEIFLDDDMNFMKLSPGTTCTLAILHICNYEFKTGYTFWATPADVDNFSYVNVELSTLISDHCQSVSTPYEPAFRELCLAEFEGGWYRAVCAEHSGDVYKVFFVDFGNCCEVNRESIRKMQKEFLKAPALAMNCTLIGRNRLKGNAELTEETYSALMEKMNSFIDGVTVKKIEDDTYFLEIPEIEAMLAR